VYCCHSAYMCFSFSQCNNFFFSSRRRHTRSKRDWSSDVCSSDLTENDATPRGGTAMKPTAQNAGIVHKKAGFLKTFKKNLPLTLMALPALIIMFLFRYLPMAGLLLAFKRFSVRKGIFGSDWVWFDNFEFLFKTSDAWIITRNTICYNALFILMDLVFAVAMAIGLNELLRKRRAKIYQTIFMAPYFLSWVVVSFMAFSLFSVDDGLFNHLLDYFGFAGVDWYSDPGKWPFILTFFQLWKTIGYSTVMYIISLTGISNDYYEAAIINGAIKWQKIKRR